MIETFAALAGVVLAFAFMYPWVLAILPAPRSAVKVALTTVALSAGALTLGMFAVVVAAPRLLTRGVLQGGMVLVFALGAWWLARAKVVERPPRPGLAQRALEATRRHPLEAGTAALILFTAALVLFNAAYWPFGRQDAIAVYGQLGRYLYYHGAFPFDLGGDGIWHEAYPMLVPLSHAYTHMLAGGINEYLAGLANAVLCVGVMGGTYAVGCAMFGAVEGLAAAMLMALTPMYTRWASAGYADLPAAFFFTLCALYVWQHHESGRARDAVLAGIMAGLAAWTKNSALILAGSLPLWFVYMRLRQDKSVQRRGAAWMLGAMALTAGPWYLRSVWLYGVVIPPTGWTWLAERTASNLVPFLVEWPDYWIPGAVFTVGAALTLWRAAWGEMRDALLAMLCGPLFGVWWLLFSYETRFLLLILPLVAVMGGRWLAPALAWFGRRRWKTAAALVAVWVVALPALRDAVLFKDELLHTPRMSDAEKHRLQTGPAFEVAAFLDGLPPGTVVLSTLDYVGYYAGPNVSISMDWTKRFEADYWVLAPEDPLPAGTDAERCAEIGGARVYRILLDDQETPNS